MGGASSNGDSGADNKTKFGYTKPTNPIKQIAKDGGLILSAIKNNPISKYTEKVNRNFFDTKVKKAGKSKYDNYEDYIRARSKGEVDAYGREITNAGNNRPEDENQPLLNIKPEDENQQVASGVVTNNATAPSNAEVTQAQSTDMSADQILLANKKKGRTSTILNSSQGLGGSTANTTKKTLGA